MPKVEWGKKVVCLNCEAKFYDLNRKPAVCPKCGTEYIDPAIDNISSKLNKFLQMKLIQSQMIIW